LIGYSARREGRKKKHVESKVSRGTNKQKETLALKRQSTSTRPENGRETRPHKKKNKKNPQPKTSRASYRAGANDNPPIAHERRTDREKKKENGVSRTYGKSVQKNKMWKGHGSAKKYLNLICHVE